jgi:hypothetical protein
MGARLSTIYTYTFSVGAGSGQKGSEAQRLVRNIAMGLRGTELARGRMHRACLSLSLIVLTLGWAACSGSNNSGAASPATEQPTTALTTTASQPSPSAIRPTPPAGTGSGSLLGLSTATPTSSSAAASATPLSSQQLDQLSLTPDDLPSGFAITGSGPGGPELGRDVLASYQEEFQQRDVTSTQSLQQTIIVIDLLGQYKDTSSALSGLKAVNAQSLNQLLGSVNLSAEAATIPAISDDATAFHFSGDTNGTSIGGYMVLFHSGPIATLILSASVKGSESLQQTVDLAQKQAQRLQVSR